MAEHGRVIAIGDELLGDEFAEDTAAGSTVLQLVDVADFDEAGGKVRIGGVVVDYLTVDDAAATMTLAAGLLADADAGDHLDAWDEATNTAAIDRIASVAFDGQTDGEAIECVVAQHLRRELPPGIRGEIGESVLIETEGDEWRVIDVLGVREQAAVRFWQDQFIVAAPGMQELDLTFEPILNSEHLYWNGVYQPQTEWSRAADVITVPDLDDYLEAGDELTVEYAYLPGAAISATAEPAETTYAGAVDVPLTGGVPGQYLVAAALVKSGNTYSANGFTATETGTVTHDVGGASLTYKLVVFRGVIGGAGTLPTVTSIADDQPWVIASVPTDDPTTLTVGTVADDTDADVPASTGDRTIRIWATIGDVPHIDPPGTVTVHAGFNPPYNPSDVWDLAIVLADDTDDGSTRNATSPVSVGWFLASIGLTG